jgi:hypothetical protein
MRKQETTKNAFTFICKISFLILVTVCLSLAGCITPSDSPEQVESEKTQKPDKPKVAKPKTAKPKTTVPEPKFKAKPKVSKTEETPVIPADDYREKQYKWLVAETLKTFKNSLEESETKTQEKTGIIFLKNACHYKILPKKSLPLKKIIDEGQKLATRKYKNPVVITWYAFLRIESGKPYNVESYLRKAISMMQMRKGSAFQLALASDNLVDFLKGENLEEKKKILFNAAMNVTCQALAQAVAESVTDNAQAEYLFDLAAAFKTAEIRKDFWQKVLITLKTEKTANPWFNLMAEGKALLENPSPENRQSALKKFQSAWQLNPKAPQSATEIILLAKTNQERLQWFDKALSCGRKNPQAYQNLTQALQGKEKLDFAIKNLKENNYSPEAGKFFLQALFSFAGDSPYGSWQKIFRVEAIQKEIDELYRKRNSAKGLSQLEKHRLQAEQVLISTWEGNYKKAREQMTRLPKDTDFKKVFPHQDIPWLRPDSSELKEEISLFTGSQGKTLENWENLMLAGKSEDAAKSISSLLIPGRIKSKGFNYLRDRQALSMIKLPVKNYPSDWAPLELAIKTRNPKAAKFLIENNADFNTHDADGWTPLMTALSVGQTETAKLIIEHGAPISTVGPGGWTPLMIAVKNNLTDTAMLLIGMGAKVDAVTSDHKLTPLHLAAANGNVDLIIRLIGKGAKVDQVDKAGNTPLHMAAIAGKVKAVQMLLKKKADPNIKNLAGRTPLNSAIARGKKEVIDVLSKP